MVENQKAPPSAPADAGRRVISIPDRTSQDASRDEASKRLIVGQDISLSGEIGDCDVLVVEGRVSAILRNSRRIEVGESGAFEGNVEIETAEIKGRFEGEMIARERLVIRRTGRVAGRIRYAELEIERGGEITGDIEVFAAESGPRLAAAQDGVGEETEANKQTLKKKQNARA
jgi:cytoskeletal protein CcmA (bactofilin family)